MFLQRHGESETNVQGVFTCRRLDPDLTDLGREQIKQNVALYRDADITHIITSPSKRAISTAEILSESLELPVTHDESLLELDVGDLEGRPEDDQECLRVFFGTLSDWLNGVDGTCFPGGESGSDVAGRIAALTELASPTSLLVGHAGIFAMLMGSRGLPFSRIEELFMPRAGVARYVQDTESWNVIGRAGPVAESALPWQA